MPAETELARWAGVSGCDVVEEVLPYMLATLVGLLGLATLVCLAAAVLATLAHRAQRRRSQRVRWSLYDCLNMFFFIVDMVFFLIWWYF